MGLIKFLNSLDEILFLNLVNWGPDSLDYFFQVLSMSIGTYVLVILFLIFAFFKLKLNEVVLLASLIIVGVGLADIISVHGFKNTFERLRPCHSSELIEQFELVANRCGGRYGFVSSHASTIWTIFAIVNFSRPPKIFILIFLFWAILVSYSRVYLGVHYPGDILGGAILGLLIANALNRWRSTPNFKY